MLENLYKVALDNNLLDISFAEFEGLMQSNQNDYTQRLYSALSDRGIDLGTFENFKNQYTERNFVEAPQESEEQPTQDATFPLNQYRTNINKDIEKTQRKIQEQQDAALLNFMEENKVKNVAPEELELINQNADRIFDYESMVERKQQFEQENNILGMNVEDLGYKMPTQDTTLPPNQAFEGTVTSTGIEIEPVKKANEDGQVLGTYIDKVKEELPENSQLSEKEIVGLAKDKYIQDEELIIFNENFEETIEKMKDDEQFLPLLNITKSQKQNELYSWAKSLKDREAKKAVQLEHNFQQHVVELEKIIDIQTNLQNKTYKTQEEVDVAMRQFRELNLQRDRHVNSLEKIFDQQKIVAKSDQDLVNFIDMSGRNYGAVTNLVGNLGKTLLGMGIQVEELNYRFNPKWLIRQAIAGADDKDVPEFLQPYVQLNRDILDKRNLAKEKLREIEAGIGNSLQKVKTIDDIDGFEDFGEWLAHLTATQAPNTVIMLTTGGAALPILGAIATGSKFEEMQKEIDLYGAEYSPLQMYSAALLTGAAEVVSEKFTLGYLRKQKAIFKANQQTKRSFINWFKQEVTLPNVTRYGKDTFGEGFTELGATLGNNVADKFILGKNISLTDGMKDAFFSGMAMSGLVYKTPGIGLNIFNAFQSKDSNQKIGENGALIRELTGRLSDPKLKLTEENKTAIKNQIEELVMDSNRILGKDIKNIDKLTNKEQSELIEIHNDLFTLRQDIDNFRQNKDLTQEQIDKFTKSLVTKQVELLGRKSEILSELDTREALEQNIKLAETGAKQGLSEGVTRMDTDAQFDKAVDDVKNNPNLNENEKNSITSGDAKLADGFTTSDDKIYINTRVAEKMGAIGVGSHEMLHTILKVTVKDPVVRKKVVDNFLKTLSASERAIVERRIGQNYKFEKTEDGQYFKLDKRGKKIEIDESQYNEEYLTAFSDAIVQGDIQYSESLFKKLGRILLQMFRGYGYTNAKWDSGQDVYNFIKEYSINAKAGKLDTVLLKQVKTKGATGALTEVTVEDAKLARSLNEKGVLDAKDTVKKSKSGDVLSSINNLIPDNISTKQQYNNFLGSEGFTKVYNAIQNQGGVINNYIRSRQTSKEEGDKTIEAVIDRVLNFNPEAKRQDGTTVGNKGFGEAIFANVRFGKLDARKDLAMEAERQRVEGGDMEVASKVIADETADAKLDTPKDTRKPARSKIDPTTFAGVPSTISLDTKPTKDLKVKEIDKQYTGEVGQKIFDIPANKITTPANNLTLDQARKIQQFFGKADNLSRFLTILPEFNVATNITEVGLEKLDVPKDVRGIALGITKTMQDLFYENYVDPTGKMTTPKGRSKGATSQTQVKRLKPEFLQSITKETLDAVRAKIGITPTGELNVLPRGAERSSIGQSLKGMAKLYSQLTATTLVRKALPKAKPKELVASKAGTRNIMFSKHDGYTTKKWEDIATDNGTDWYDVRKDPERYANDIVKVAKIFEKKFGYGFLSKAMLTNKEGLGISTKPKKDANKNIIKGKGGNEAIVKENQRIFDVISDIIRREVPNISKGSEGDKHVKKRLDKNFVTTKSKKEIEAANKQNMRLFKDMWSTIYDIVQEDKSLTPTLLYFLKNAVSEGSHIQRLGAEYIGGYFDKSQIGRLEHALQNANTGKMLMDAALNQSKEDFNKTFKATVKNYKIIGLPIALDNILNKTDFKNKMSLDQSWDVFNNNWWERYFNEVVGAVEGGINPDLIITNDGRRLSDIINVDTYGRSTTPNVSDAKVKAKVDYPKVLKFSKSTPNKDKIRNDLNDFDTANRAAKIINQPKKGISIFDFDDTLATSKSKVIVTTTDGKTKKLTPEQFARLHDKLQEEGAKFDFSEFTKVIDGKPGPLAAKLKKAIDKFGNKDVFVLTARPQASAQAIYEFLKGIGLEVPIKNITGLENGTPKAKAKWVVGKAAEGYNDFYFTDDVYKNVKAVQDALEIYDVKSKTRVAYNDRITKLDKDFNDIIEAKTGIGAEKVYSQAKAAAVGANKGRFTFFIPPSAEDFVGLLYNTLSKGKLGDNQMAWYKKNLLDPYATAMGNISRERIAVMNDYKELKKQLSVVPKNLNKVIPGDVYTNEQAVRVYIWNKQGMDIPGLSKADLKSLTDYVESKPQFKVLGDQLINIQKGDEYNAPNSGWLAGTITTDLQAGLGGTKRAKHLAEWQQNVDIIFSEKNLNKMEAAFGKAHRTAMESILQRMKTGVNRSFTSDGLTGQVTDWLTNSIGTIMFFNTRSALLQTISAVNFINFKDNNIFAAGKAFANQPQYWSDFMTLMNSDFLVDRRRGLRINVNEADIANMAQESGPRGVISKMLQLGFLPTQIADSFAIASGGASFYRNRIKKLVKEGMDQKAAETQAMKDFREIAEESQQSSRPDRISMQQAGPLGRIILAFGNTPMQYARLIKKAASDLINRRGDWKTNTSKLIYYSTVQNLIFNALQQAIFAIAFGDAEEEDEKKKYLSIANGMADSLLRGVGIAGAFVSVGKNSIIRIINESQKTNPKFEKIGYELTKISPPISSKLSKINQAARSYQWEKEEMMEKGFALDNPAWLAAGNVISAAVNIPLDRLIKKTNNVVNSTANDLETWERLALLGGWQDWEIGVDKKLDKKDKKKEQKGKTVIRKGTVKRK